MLRTMWFRWGLGIVCLVLVLGSFFVLGNGSASVDRQVMLSVLDDREFTQETFAKNRQNLFGLDPLSQGVTFNSKLRFTKNASKERINSDISARGALHVGANTFPLTFSGEAQVTQTKDGQDFYISVATGTVKVRGRDVPVTAFVAGIPGGQKYVVTLALQPENEKVAVFAFGTRFPEYAAWVERNQQAAQEQVKEGK